MEALIAFSIFGIAVTGIVIALHQTSELNGDVTRSQWAKQEAKNLLTEVITSPVNNSDYERDETLIIDETTEARIIVSPHEVNDKDGNLIDDLYRIEVILSWDQDGTMQQESFQTVHYQKMFPR